MYQGSVLVADDNADMRTILAGEMRKQFHVRRTLSNGKQLFDAAVEGGVDVIVTDVHMPVLSGVDVMCALRMLGRFVPFVMVSASPDLAADCLARGAAGFVSKMDIAADLIPAVLAALDGRTYVSVSARAACDLPLPDGQPGSFKPSTRRS
jgi:CheY-like chemotaxis protein